MHLFTNIIGTFIIDNNKIIASLPFESITEYHHKEQHEQKLLQKYPRATSLPPEQIPKVLALFKDQHYFSQFAQQNTLLTKDSIKRSVTEDQLIIQAIANINELDKTANLLTKRLREWYSLYLPELSEKIHNHEKYTSLVAEKTKPQLLQEISLIKETTMGAELQEQHVQEMKQLATTILHLYSLRKNHEQYLQQVMKEYCTNLLELAGVTIGAKLIELGKGLKRLALLPSSTIQLLGAEKALFRHIKTGSRSPKYGVLYQHPLIQNAHRDMKGKAARALADKLSLCIRLDYFKGEFKALEYKKRLEEKFKP